VGFRRKREFWRLGEDAYGSGWLAGKLVGLARDLGGFLVFSRVVGSGVISKLWVFQSGFGNELNKRDRGTEYLCECVALFWNLLRSPLSRCLRIS